MNAFLSLASDAGELAGAFGAGGVTREDGSFTMVDVPPGNYTLIAESVRPHFHRRSARSPFP